MPYGISAYGQSPQIGSPLQHTGSLIQQQHMGSGTTAIYAGSESNGSPASAVVISTTALQTTSSQSTSSLFRTGDEKRLTREAMERYLRDRNDMIIVVLHAKVINWCQSTRSEVIICVHFHKYSTLTSLTKQLLKFSCFWFFNFYFFFQLSSELGIIFGDLLEWMNFFLFLSFLFFKVFHINKVFDGKLFN